jgi:D-amino-acid dehydrogenase
MVNGNVPVIMNIGMIAQGIKWMFDSQSPFYVKPRLSKNLIQWGLQFYKYATPKHVSDSMPALRDLGLFSKELFRDMNKASDSFFYEEKGLLMLFKSDRWPKKCAMKAN